jgi:uncharacterized protein YqfA (UPF0365 family)
MSRDMQLVSSGLVCVVLAFVANLLDVPILTWLMFLAAAAQIGWGIFIGIRGRIDD